MSSPGLQALIWYGAVAKTKPPHTYRVMLPILTYQSSMNYLPAHMCNRSQFWFILFGRKAVGQMPISLWRGNHLSAEGHCGRALNNKWKALWYSNLLTQNASQQCRRFIENNQYFIWWRNLKDSAFQATKWDWKVVYCWVDTHSPPVAFRQDSLELPLSPSDKKPHCYTL